MVLRDEELVLYSLENFVIHGFLHVSSCIYALVLGELLALFTQYSIRLMFNENRQNNYYAIYLNQLEYNGI